VGRTIPQLVGLHGSAEEEANNKQVAQSVAASTHIIEKPSPQRRGRHGQGLMPAAFFGSAQHSRHISHLQGSNVSKANKVGLSMSSPLSSSARRH